MGSRIGRPESLWRAVLAYLAVVGIAVLLGMVLMALAWIRAS